MTRVLVVDDNSSIRDILADALELYGYEVQTARDGDEALAAAATHPDVILLDFAMPGLDGAAVARRLMELGSPASIVMVSADRAGAARARELGAAAFLAKPFELDALLQLLEKIVGSKAQ